ncbi:MAG TPA: hypothetical protein VIG08_18065 [Gemmatimonadales bacterium]|jgi:hypothetical protein
MRRVYLACLMITSLVASPALAQDSTVPGSQAPGIRKLIEERFAQRIKEQLGLTDAQMGRLRETTGKFGGRRRELEGHQLAIRRALAMQLRPGTAANKDSVAKLTDELLAGRVAYAKSFQDELAELKTYLDPVQRAELMAMRERLLRRAQQFRDRQGMGDAFRGRRRPFMER